MILYEFVCFEQVCHLKSLLHKYGRQNKRNVADQLYWDPKLLILQKKEGAIRKTHPILTLLSESRLPLKALN